jgi:hypothetical protein
MEEVGKDDARHVIATIIQLDHCTASIAALPALLLGQGYSSLKRWICGTIITFVERRFARRTSLSEAHRAFCSISRDLSRKYKFSASHVTAVCSVLRRELNRRIMESIEFIAREFSLDVLEWNRLATASWREERFIGGGVEEERF